MVIPSRLYSEALVLVPSMDQPRVDLPDALCPHLGDLALVGQSFPHPIPLLVVVPSQMKMLHYNSCVLEMPRTFHTGELPHRPSMMPSAAKLRLLPLPRKVMKTTKTAVRLLAVMARHSLLGLLERSRRVHTRPSTLNTPANLKRDYSGSDDQPFQSHAKGSNNAIFGPGVPKLSKPSKSKAQASEAKSRPKIPSLAEKRKLVRPILRRSLNLPTQPPTCLEKCQMLPPHNHNLNLEPTKKTFPLNPAVSAAGRVRRVAIVKDLANVVKTLASAPKAVLARMKATVARVVLGV